MAAEDESVLDKLHLEIVAGRNAVAQLKVVLDLPFYPVRLMPLVDALETVNRARGVLRYHIALSAALRAQTQIDYCAYLGAET